MHCDSVLDFPSARVSVSAASAHVFNKYNTTTKSSSVCLTTPSRATVDTLRAEPDREYYYRDLGRTVEKKKRGSSARARARKSRKKVENDVEHGMRGVAGGAKEEEEGEETEGVEGKKIRRRNAADDSVRRYLHEIGEVHLLDADSEVDLGRDIAKLVELENVSARLKDATGMEPGVADWATAAGMDVSGLRRTLRRGIRAKEHMVAANLRLVVSIAKKYLNRGLSFQDLIQEGSLGLIRGAEKFDVDKGFKFSTYATWWIRQAITRAIADQSRMIRLPVHVNDTLNCIRRTTKLLSSELNRVPTDAEIAARMQISVEKVRLIIKSSRAMISLETPMSKDGKDSIATLGSFIMWDGESPDENATKMSLREDLENVLNTLSPRERDVVRMRYGLDDGRMKTLEEIGGTFAVTRERIRQIESKALRKLRHPNRNAGLREYVCESW